MNYLDFEDDIKALDQKRQEAMLDLEKMLK